MSRQPTTDPIGRLEISEPLNSSLSKLAELARQAYERRETKDCLDLTRAILLVDPDNTDAQWMRSAIQTEMQRDLESARAVMRQAQVKDASEAAVPSIEPEPASPSALNVEPRIGISRPIAKRVPVSAASPALRFPAKRWAIPVGVLLVLSPIVFSLPSFRARSNSVVSQSAPSEPVAQPAAGPPVQTAGLPAPPARLVAVASAPLPASSTPRRPAAPIANGTLAVSSPTSVDIYRGDAYLGSVPVSLDLPPGMHTLEYRHGGLRRAVTHVINSQVTTKAMITFDINVQINSRPWADVYVDGVERRSLGQTPLSGVQVPIGSVLVFENPQFPAKKYRVNGDETGIQIVFP